MTASDGNDYLFAECKWRNDRLDKSVLNSLKRKSQVFDRQQEKVFYVLFSKGGFTQGVIDEAEKAPHLLMFDLNDLITY